MVGTRSSSALAASPAAAVKKTRNNKQSVKGAVGSTARESSSKKTNRGAGQKRQVAVVVVAEQEEDVMPDVLVLQSPDVWQPALVALYMYVKHEAIVCNAWAIKDDDPIMALPIYPSIETHTVQGKDMKKILPVPVDFRAGTRGDLLSLPAAQLGRLLKDYRLDASGNQKEQLNRLLQYLGAPKA